MGSNRGPPQAAHDRSQNDRPNWENPELNEIKNKQMFPVFGKLSDFAKFRCVFGCSFGNSLHVRLWLQKKFEQIAQACEGRAI